MASRPARADYSVTDGGWKYFFCVMIFLGIVTSFLTMLSSNRKSSFDATSVDEPLREGLDNALPKEEKTAEDEEAMRLRQLSQRAKLKENNNDNSDRKHQDDSVQGTDEADKEPPTTSATWSSEADMTKSSIVDRATDKTASTTEHVTVRTIRKKGVELPTEQEQSSFDDKPPTEEMEGGKQPSKQHKPTQQLRKIDQRTIRTFKTKNGQSVNGPQSFDRRAPSSLQQSPLKVRVIRTKGKRVEQVDVPVETPPSVTPDKVDERREFLDISQTGHKVLTVRYVRIKPGAESVVDQAELPLAAGGAQDHSSQQVLSIRYRRIKAKDHKSQKFEEWKVLIPKVSLNSAGMGSALAKNDALTMKITVLPEKVDALEERTVQLPSLKHSVTNQLDFRIRGRLELADRLLSERRLEESLHEFESILRGYPTSPRSRYGKAVSLDLLSDSNQSNDILERAIYAYEAVINLPNVPDELLKMAVHRLVERCRFRGWFDKAIKAQVRLLEKHPKDTSLLNDFAITLLMMNRYDDAKRVFLSVLDKESTNAEALLYYGYILKTVDEEHEKAIHFMARGLALGVQIKRAARFVVHLGDALYRLNRTEEAYELYDEASRHGIFLNRYQRSMYNVGELTAKPWWIMSQTNCNQQLKKFERDWRLIREESLRVWNAKSSAFERVEPYVEAGDQKQMTLFFPSGAMHEKNCALVPKICEIIASISVPESGCRTAEARLVATYAGTETWPHCAFTNCYLTAILGVAVPHGSWLRVHNETRPLILGRLLLFDPSFEHRTYAGGNGWQLVLTLDLWHPELTEEQQQSLNVT
ncbi:aspartyl:asparaginyl beta hydroxylase [Trichuris trichiura]|uniref:Aspartyl:asparaginyl beta hydroxylase n=1 Tax=Trichuris trichiura TaxID=36087 RepID=A0A077Z3C7_TRITR|nr:aspartyl:asparaginyl beta hydroxylase [Trichuris trichiura]